MEQDFFGGWMYRRRKALDMTRLELAQCVGCSVSTLRKIEAGERRPSKQLAGLLADRLGVPPGDRPAFVKAARGEVGADRLRPLPSALPPEQMVLTHFHNVTIPSTPLVGRVAELAALGQMLRDPQCRLLSVIGPGGIGKTRLAVEAASAVGDIFADGVFVVAMDGLSSPEFVVPAIAEAVGFSSSDPTGLKAQFLSYLRQRAVLLVLDGFESLMEAGGVLTEILRQAPRAKLLTTSRERLDLQAEWTFEVHGLPVSPECQATGLQTYGAAELFVQCARRSKFDFELSAEEYPSVVRICQLVEGLPLAIELAASWVRTLSCQEIAQEIERNWDFLTTTMRDVPERHRSLRAVFDYSWSLLSDAERGVLRRLPVFPGSFCREAVEQVIGVSLELLKALVDKSLLRREADGRYRMHEQVRQFAVERLRENPEEEFAIRERHSHYYLSMVQDHEAPHAAGVT